MIRLCIIGVLFFSFAVAAEFDLNDENNFYVADGEPLFIEDKGITISPPKGWQVFRNYPNTTLLLQAPIDESLKYRRTIQIMSFSGAEYIDEISAARFDDLIVRRFAEAAGNISNYRIRNHLPVKLETGVPAFLFYAEFEVDYVKLMQMHILVSSSSKHFIMTFTDLAEYFDADNPVQDHLNEAWQTLNSVNLDSSGPSRFGLPFGVLAAILVFLVLISVLRWFLAKQAKRSYDDYAEGNFVPEDGEEEALLDTIEDQPFSRIDSGNNTDRPA